MTSLTLSILPRKQGRPRPDAIPLRPTGMAWLMGSELVASAIGFGVLVHLARRLGPPGFARVEYASGVAAWLLVLVRGGIDVIVYREAARRPRLIHRLTEHLLGLRCAAAGLGYLMVLVVAALVGPERGAVVAVAGWLLVPSAFVTDVVLRASGRLRPLALAQGVRVLGYLLSVLVLVRGPDDVLWGAFCLVAAEAAGALVPLWVHTREFRFPRPRFGRRVWSILIHRGAIAGLTRFGRVTLYGADLLALGWWAGPELGPYAAARRIVFALVALGLVIPIALGPPIALGWTRGAAVARELIAGGLVRIWALSLPAAAGLALIAGLLMPRLFGPGYRQGAPWLVLIAARLPWLLSATFAQSALIACRRERSVLSLTLGLLVSALIVIPAAAAWRGPWGVGCAALALEMAGAVGGWVLLDRLGIAPRWGRGGDR